jgi:hypothetical protein
MQQAQAHQCIQGLSNGGPAEREVFTQVFFHRDLFTDLPSSGLNFLAQELGELIVAGDWRIPSDC